LGERYEKYLIIKLKFDWSSFLSWFAGFSLTAALQIIGKILYSTAYMLFRLC
jgi:hypothetical protein